MENSTLNTTFSLKWYKTEMWKSGSYSCKIIDCTKLKLIIALTDKMTTPIMLVFLMNVCTFFFFTKMNVWWDVGVPVKHRGSCQITVFKGVIQQAWQTRYDRVHLTGNGWDLFPIIHHFPKEGLQTHYKALTHWLTARTCWKQASRDIRHQNTAIKLLQRCRSCTNSYINTVW